MRVGKFWTPWKEHQLRCFPRCARRRSPIRPRPGPSPGGEEKRSSRRRHGADELRVLDVGRVDFVGGEIVPLGESQALAIEDLAEEGEPERTALVRTSSQSSRESSICWKVEISGVVGSDEVRSAEELELHAVGPGGPSEPREGERLDRLPLVRGGDFGENERRGVLSDGASRDLDVAHGCPDLPF